MYMTKKDFNRIGYDVRTEEFTLTLANDDSLHRIPRKDFIPEPDALVPNSDILFFFLDKMSELFGEIINTSVKLFITEVAMQEIESLETASRM